MFHAYGIFNTHTLNAYQYIVPMGLPLNAVRHDILVRGNTVIAKCHRHEIF
jgi:hypothetical protein